MPSTGTEKSAGPGTAEGGSGPGAKSSKSGSMKMKRSSSSAKVLTKSKSSGSLKKKGEQPTSASAPKPQSKDVHRSLSAGREVDLLDPKQNGSLRRGEEEGAEEEDDEVWEQEGEKKEGSIKGLWKKAFKNMRNPAADSKWLNRASFKRRDSKYDAEEAEEEEPKEIDPVYSLLKCAADLPKIARSTSREGQPSPGCQGVLCSVKASSPAPPGISQMTSSGASCTSCRGHHHSNEPSSSHSLGHDFKEFYKQTSPVKRLSSSDLGI